MELGLHGRVALVTASSRGLGFASAAALVEEGTRVLICGRSKDSVEAAHGELQSRARHGASRHSIERRACIVPLTTFDHQPRFVSTRTRSLAGTSALAQAATTILFHRADR